MAALTADWTAAPLAGSWAASMVVMLADSWAASMAVTMVSWSAASSAELRVGC